MGKFYIDDSVHDEAGFIIGACIYTESDINQKIIDLIKSCDFNPDDFEYKSSSNYSKESKKIKVRGLLKRLLFENCKLGIVVIPRERREQFGFECIKALRQFIDHNEEIKTPISIYFDEGMFRSKDKAQYFINSLNFLNCTFYLEQNSLEIKGIQLADLAAHISSIQLKDAMGLVTKMVKAGSNSGYDPDLDIELGFEMWANLRYSFFNEGSKLINDNIITSAIFKVEPYGLYISDFCDQTLSNIARTKFGNIYLGCIH